MFGRVPSEGRRGQSALAWLGLLLMAASFVWLQLLPPREAPPQVEADTPAAEGPFALVVIDPGHGGLDSGTMKTGMVEKELTLDVAHRLERLLRARGVATLLHAHGR